MKTIATPRTAQATLLVTLLALTLACGYSSKNNAPAPGVVPAIAQLNPDTAKAGSGAFTLTVNGSNFGTKAVVNWNGAAQAAGTTYVSGNQLTVAIPASLTMTAETVSVTVTNPGTPGMGIYGSGGTSPETSAPVSFSIN
jgi:hypothetical protein